MSEYPKAFKLEVAEYVKCFGQRSTSRLFDISQRRIFDWSSNYEHYRNGKTPIDEHTETISNPILIDSDGNTQVGRGNTSKSFPTLELPRKCATQLKDFEVEEEVLAWAKSQLPLRVSSTQIRDKARELYRLKGHHNFKCSYGWYRRWCKRFDHATTPHEENDPDLVAWLLQQFDNNRLVTHSELQNFAKSYMKSRKLEFKGSAGWSSRFFKRHHILLNWDGHYDLPLPSTLDAQVQTFRAKDEITKWRNGQLQWNIVCMDEIPLSFSSTYTTISGSSTVVHPYPIRQRNSIKNCEATVILSMLQSGVLLPPMIIVKSQNTTNINQVYTKCFDNGKGTTCENPVIVFYASSCEPSVKSLEKWVDLVLTKYINLNESTLLLCDAYDIHELVRAKCLEHQVTLEIFPPGTACKLQPLNVFVRREFIKRVDQEWRNYLASNVSAEAKLNLPSNNEIVDWVYSAFSILKSHTEDMRSSFSVAGFIPHTS